MHIKACPHTITLTPVTKVFLVLDQQSITDFCLPDSIKNELIFFLELNFSVGRNKGKIALNSNAKTPVTDSYSDLQGKKHAHYVIQT